MQSENQIDRASRNSVKGLDKAQKHLAKLEPKIGHRFFVFLNKEDGTFIVNEEDRVHLLLRIYFPRSTVQHKDILPYTKKIDRRKKKINWKLVFLSATSEGPRNYARLISKDGKVQHNLGIYTKTMEIDITGLYFKSEQK